MAANITHTAFFPPISVIGREAELERKRVNLVEECVIRNLVTNQLEIFTLNQAEIKRCDFSAFSFMEKMVFFFQHAKQASFLYQEALILGTIFAVATVVSIMAARWIRATLNTTYQNVLANRFIYQGTLEKVGFEHYYKQWFSLWGSYGLLGLPIPFFLGGGFFESLLSIKHSFVDFHHQLSAVTQVQTIKKDLSKLANDVTEEGFVDPISLEVIKKEWAQAPRFIKVGNYLLTLNSLLCQLFSKDLTEGQIKHLIENRPLTNEEQEEVVDQLSQLFAIEKEEIVCFFDPYYGDFFKEEIKKNPQYVNASEHEKPAVLLELVFEADLSRQVKKWATLNAQKKAYIKFQLRKDWFASRRITNFLTHLKVRLSENVLEVKNEINETTFFNLMEIFDEEAKRTFRINLR